MSMFILQAQMFKYDLEAKKAEYYAATGYSQIGAIAKDVVANLANMSATQAKEALIFLANGVIFPNESNVFVKEIEPKQCIELLGLINKAAAKYPDALVEINDLALITGKDFAVRRNAAQSLSDYYSKLEGDARLGGAMSILKGAVYVQEDGGKKQYMQMLPEADQMADIFKIAYTTAQTKQEKSDILAWIENLGKLSQDQISEDAPGSFKQSVKKAQQMLISQIGKDDIKNNKVIRNEEPAPEIMESKPGPVSDMKIEDKVVKDEQKTERVVIQKKDDSKKSKKEKNKEFELKKKEEQKKAKEKKDEEIRKAKEKKRQENIALEEEKKKAQKAKKSKNNAPTQRKEGKKQKNNDEEKKEQKVDEKPPETIEPKVVEMEEAPKVEDKIDKNKTATTGEKPNPIVDVQDPNAQGIADIDPARELLRLKDITLSDKERADAAANLAIYYSKKPNGSGAYDSAALPILQTAISIDDNGKVSIIAKPLPDSKKNEQEAVNEIFLQALQATAGSPDDRLKLFAYLLNIRARIANNEEYRKEYSTVNMALQYAAGASLPYYAYYSSLRDERKYEATPQDYISWTEDYAGVDWLNTNALVFPRIIDALADSRGLEKFPKMRKAAYLSLESLLFASSADEVIGAADALGRMNFATEEERKAGAQALIKAAARQDLPGSPEYTRGVILYNLLETGNFEPVLSEKERKEAIGAYTGNFDNVLSGLTSASGMRDILENKAKLPKTVQIKQVREYLKRLKEYCKAKIDSQDDEFYTPRPEDGSRGVPLKVKDASGVEKSKSEFDYVLSLLRKLELAYQGKFNAENAEFSGYPIGSEEGALIQEFRNARFYIQGESEKAKIGSGKK